MFIDVSVQYISVVICDLKHCLLLFSRDLSKQDWQTVFLAFDAFVIDFVDLMNETLATCKCEVKFSAVQNLLRSMLFQLFNEKRTNIFVSVEIDEPEYPLKHVRTERDGHAIPCFENDLQTVRKRCRADPVKNLQCSIDATETIVAELSTLLDNDSAFLCRTFECDRTLIP